ncbi:foldase protein PrsA [Lactococcus hodotermopsidis]|uniref:Foldase protein PrsA n=1 Tax=Pseudolactococcus hodotermopsidis TaxID=2709157 RepID=A0A6A0BD25_9LACT|nr:foldase [Lactococcus hodotermopsidis]GFH41727.1 foldase protein PrsA [Lactococcus hodotermopsidis]
MKLKKMGLVVVTALSAMMLVACSKDSTNTDIVTMKGDTITVLDLYEQEKIQPTTGAETILQNMTLNKIFEKEFGKKLTKADVQKDFDKQKESIGENFVAALAQANLTEKSFKASIRAGLLQQMAIKKDIKITDDDYKKAFETYHPEVEAYIISTQNEEEAKTTIADGKKDGAAFDKTAKEKEAETKFTSADTQVPIEVKEAAWKLKEGEISAEPIPVADPTYGTTSYYVVKMIKSSDKGTDWKKYKKELKEVITSEKMSDITFVNSIFAKYLTKYNVKVKPEEFSAIFSDYEAAVTASTETSK